MGKAGEDGGAQPERPPELVAAVVAFLVHDSCHLSGEIAIAGTRSGDAAFHGGDGRLFEAGSIPEDVRNNWSSIQDEAGYTIPVGTISHGIEFDKVIDRAVSHNS